MISCRGLVVMYWSVFKLCFRAWIRVWTQKYINIPDTMFLIFRREFLFFYDIYFLFLMQLLVFQIQLKYLAEGMQEIHKGLEIVEQELSFSDSEGSSSGVFHKVKINFPGSCASVFFICRSSLISIYWIVIPPFYWLKLFEYLVG